MNENIDYEELKQNCKGIKDEIYKSIKNVDKDINESNIRLNNVKTLHTIFISIYLPIQIYLWSIHICNYTVIIAILVGIAFAVLFYKNYKLINNIEYQLDNFKSIRDDTMIKLIENRILEAEVNIIENISKNNEG